MNLILDYYQQLQESQDDAPVAAEQWLTIEVEAEEIE